MKRKNISKLIICIIALIVFIPVSKAAKCDYTIRSEASKIAKNVSASYEVQQTEDGLYYFNITVYNIVDGIYVSISESGGSSRNSSRDIFPTDTDEQGNYTFRVYDTFNIIKYTFKVGDLKSGCTSSIRTFSLTKPKYNDFSELEECNFYGVEDFMYCQQWITTDFKLTEEGVLEKIRLQRQKSLEQVTTKCLSCEENEKIRARNERFYKIRKYFIIGLSCGIVADIALIIFLFIKIRREII